MNGEKQATIFCNKGAKDGKYESLVRFHKWHEHIHKMLAKITHTEAANCSTYKQARKTMFFLPY